MMNFWNLLAVISSLMVVCHGEKKSRIFGKMEKYPTRTGQKLVDPVKSGRLSRGEKKKLAKAEQNLQKANKLLTKGLQKINKRSKYRLTNSYKKYYKKQEKDQNLTIINKTANANASDTVRCYDKII